MKKNIYKGALIGGVLLGGALGATVAAGMVISSAPALLIAPAVTVVESTFLGFVVGSTTTVTTATIGI